MVDFKVLMVCGSRSIEDHDFVWKCIEETYKTYKFDTIIEGGADGVDSLAGLFTIYHRFNHMTIYPQWNKHGNKAGFMRNSDLVEICNKGIAMWDGKSTGTKDSITKLKKVGKLLKVFKYENKT